MEITLHSEARSLTHVRKGMYILATGLIHGTSKTGAVHPGLLAKLCALLPHDVITAHEFIFTSPVLTVWKLNVKETFCGLDC